MKTKNITFIFILFLLITLASGLVVLLTGEKNQPVLSEQYGAVERSAESASKKSVKAAATAPKQIVEPKKTEAPETVNNQAEEKIKAVMLINGVKYEAEVKAGSSVYDLMNVLKAENKINFSGKNYSGLGFFVEEIDGLKNNPAGANWLYYVNGQPAQVGISNYLIKANDIIEWKYEKKSF
jgi:hypothetical protein